MWPALATTYRVRYMHYHIYMDMPVFALCFDCSTVVRMYSCVLVLNKLGYALEYVTEFSHRTLIGR